MKAKQLTRETINSLGVFDRKFAEFGVGDLVIVSQRIVEGDKERIQDFKGDVIAMRNPNSIRKSFIVRKIGADLIAIEVIFPYYSPLIHNITLVRKGGDIRRAKLFYMRDRVGKAARIKERVVTREQRTQQEEARKAE